MNEPASGAPRQGTVDRDRPYPGLQAFSESDGAFFYGRKRETFQLLRLVKRRVLTVCFGSSGLGKTSLLNAGLFPRLREALLFPIPLRLDFALRSGDLARQVLSKVAAEATAHDVEAPAASERETLWEYFHRARFWDRHNRLREPVIVFDQFEEIFTLGERDERVGAFVEELADLVENRIPACLRHRSAQSGEELPFAIDRPHYRVVLSLREDFLPHLEDLLPQIPSLGQNRFRLTTLCGAQALEAILEPAKEIVPEHVALEILRFASGPGSMAVPDQDLAEVLDQLKVEPALLSLFCHELNERRLERGLPQITKKLLKGASQQIVSGFYEKCVTDKAPEVRAFIENRLLTGSGFRKAEALEEALATTGVTGGDIDDLVDRRLLRREERLGIPHVELIHDVLAKVVVASRDERRQRETALHERKAVRRRWKRIGATIGVAIVLAFVMLALWGVSKAMEATEKAKQANAEMQLREQADELIAELTQLRRDYRAQSLKLQEAAAQIEESLGATRGSPELRQFADYAQQQTANIAVAEERVDKKLDSYSKASDKEILFRAAEDTVASDQYAKFRRARDLRTAGDAQRAAEMLEEIVEDNATFYMAWYNLALAYNSLDHRSEKTGEAFRRAMELEPDQPVRDATIYNSYGAYLGNSGRHREAIAFYEKALRMDPNHKKARKNMELSKTALRRRGEIP